MNGVTSVLHVFGCHVCAKLQKKLIEKNEQKVLTVKRIQSGVGITLLAL